MAQAHEDQFGCITAKELFNRMQRGGGYMLIDVRCADLYLTSHIVSALHLSLPSEDQWGQLEEGTIPVDSLCLSADQKKIFSRPNLLRSAIVYLDVEREEGLTPLISRFLSLLKAQRSIINVLLLSASFEEFQERYSFMTMSGEQSGYVERVFANEILDHCLWLGSRRNASDHEGLQALGITRVLQFYDEGEGGRLTIIGEVTDSCEVQESVTRVVSDAGFEYLNICMSDVEGRSISLYFDVCLETLSKWAEQDQRILVHCNQGISRSSTITILYCMRQCNFTLREAFDYVERMRPVISPNLSFFQQLGQWESNHTSQRTISDEEMENHVNGGRIPFPTFTKQPSKTNNCGLC